MRIVGLESETLEILDKRVLIDDRLIEEPWVIHSHAKTFHKGESPRDNLDPIIIPVGAVFVMGDNRDFSHDSRFGGFLGLRDIQAKALYICWAEDLSRIGREIK